VASGMDKSLCISRCAEQLDQILQRELLTFSAGIQVTNTFRGEISKQPGYSLSHSLINGVQYILIHIANII